MASVNTASGRVVCAASILALAACGDAYRRPRAMFVDRILVPYREATIAFSPGAVEAAHKMMIGFCPTHAYQIERERTAWVPTGAVASTSFGATTARGTGQWEDYVTFRCLGMHEPAPAGE